MISTKASSVLEMSVDQNQGTNEDGDVVVIDRIIKVTEVSCVDTQRVITQEKLDSLETSMLVLDQALFREGESVGNSSCIEHDVFNATEQAIKQNEVTVPYIFGIHFFPIISTAEATTRLELSCI